MAEVTEQEAREALARIEQDVDSDKTPNVIDLILSASFLKFELARREAERAERAKPIDAEWCLSNGAISLTPEFVFFRIPDGHNLNVYLDPKDSYVAYGSNSFPAVTTRGQLLDLLAALKGGES